MTPNDFALFKVKNTIMHATYTPEAQFSSILLYDEPFLSYGPILGKALQMTFFCSRSKIPRWMLDTLPRQIFSSVSLYDELFLSYGPIFRKVHGITPDDLDMFKVKNTNMHVTHTPPGPKFLVLFTL